jgi:NAD(P) transhydrogenase subunit alpha
VKEQVESLGGKFIDVPYETQEEKEAAEGVGGYAKPMPASWLDAPEGRSRQARGAGRRGDHHRAHSRPCRAGAGHRGHGQVHEARLGDRRPRRRGPDGVGGNCPLTEADKTVIKHGVTIVGETNLAALVAADASALYARNVLDFLKLILTKEGALKIDLEDDIVAACR